MPWLLRSTVERDDETGEPLYWHNEDGWVHKATANHYSQQERDAYMGEGLAIGGVWEIQPS